MRVIFYFGVFARIGGIEEFTADLCLSLLKRGWDVGILCAAPRLPTLDLLEDAGVEIIRLPFSKGCRWNLPDRLLFPLARKHLADADIVIHQKPFNLRYYGLLPKGAKQVYITAYRPAEQFPDERVRTRFFSFFDLVLTQVDIFKEDLSAEGGERMPVEVLPYIPPHVQDPCFTSNNSDRLNVGMMGRIEPQKNPLYALRIVDRLNRSLSSDSHKHIHFNVYGSGTLKDEMSEMSERLGISIEFHGAYSRKDVAGIVQGNDLFVISSESEGQCIVALEILSGGRPLFATPVGALGEILNQPERGAVLPLDDAEGAASVIADWLSVHPGSNVERIQQSYLADYNPDLVGNSYDLHLRRILER